MQCEPNAPFVCLTANESEQVARDSCSTRDGSLAPQPSNKLFSPRQRFLVFVSFVTFVVIMLTSSANQYLRPEYLSPLPTTVSTANVCRVNLADFFFPNFLLV